MSEFDLLVLASVDAYISLIILGIILGIFNKSKKVVKV